MTTSRETLLRWWAIAATAILGLLAIAPVETIERIMGELSSSTVFQTVVRVLIVGTILVLVLGFYLYMLIECGLAKEVNHRSFWLMILIIIPLLSAFLYFAVTRLAAYRRDGHEERST